MPRKSKHVAVKDEEDSTKLPPHLEDQRSRVTVGVKFPTNVRFIYFGSSGMQLAVMSVNLEPSWGEN